MLVQPVFLFPSAFYLHTAASKGQILQGITQTFFKWVLRPMTPEMEPSYNEETLHETLRTGKGLKKVHDYFLVQSSWFQPRTCFLSTVTFSSAFSSKVAN